MVIKGDDEVIFEKEGAIFIYWLYVLTNVYV